MPKILVLGIGSFASSAMNILKEKGAKVDCYLNRDYGTLWAHVRGKNLLL